MDDRSDLRRQISLAEDVVGDVGQLLELGALRLGELDALSNGWFNGVVKVHVGEPQRRWSIRWQVIPLVPLCFDALREHYR
jgi:hypothetical protein